ncbi:DUF2382 domain-containing protein [Azospirillum sp. TSO22-1]|uniref:DUF2382 domain-containing protein n=1 Tax=Azospirillum sp. TSO22-1 TaxID=716789 RepID=UPI000D611343|nr:DUF2382 domain-containing protein [Azospirillum sp. TSO22-1]PWC41439.1 hypothetical protein TSO221_23290 [Azospirillum sp. TSO22-1]
MPSALTPLCGPVLPLHTEEVVVARRNTAGDTVRVAIVTREHERLVDEELTHERVEIDRVVVGRVVDAVPPIREDGDLTIIPVVEEEVVVVVERRLVLREEIHMRRVRVTERHRETVTVRRQDAEISRVRPDQRDDAG